MTDDLTQAIAVGRDDTRRFSVTLIDLKKAYNNALAADVDVVSAMWMNLSMDCAKVSNDLIPRADADLAELAALRAQVERLTGKLALVQRALEKVDEGLEYMGLYAPPSPKEPRHDGY